MVSSFLYKFDRNKIKNDVQGPYFPYYMKKINHQGQIKN
jgi:hypothetical protein